MNFESAGSAAIEIIKWPAHVGHRDPRGNVLPPVFKTATRPALGEVNRRIECIAFTTPDARRYARRYEWVRGLPVIGVD